MTSSLIRVGGLLVGLVIICSFVLVALDKLDGDAFMTGVVVPVVSGLIGAIAGIKGVQVGSEASVSPPPDAP